MPSSSLVLIVDDHAATRAFIGDVISCPGRNLLECENGSEAVASFKNNRPDWVIMDVEMPVMDGFTATRTICHAHPKARIIIVTQHQEPQWSIAALDAGAYAFLTKEHLLDLPNLLINS